MLKEKDRVQNQVEDLATILETMRKGLDAKAKMIKVKKVKKDERRFGLLDSGATNNVREMKKDEKMSELIPIEVEVALTQKLELDSMSTSLERL